MTKDPLRLSWSRTWPDDPHAQDDWCVRPPGSPNSLRIRRDTTTAGQHDRWNWVANGPKGYIARGWEDTANLAAKAAEDAYFAAVEGGA